MPRVPLSALGIPLLLAFGCELEVLRDPGTADPGGEGEGEGEVDRDRDDPSHECGAGATVLRGKVMFPSGDLPVAGALVYVPYGAGQVEHAGECGECVDEGALLAHDTTRADGTFELVGLPGGPTTVVVEKGRFRKITTVDVAACEDNLVPGESVRLPASAAEGDVPRIAVVTGYFDRMEDVIAKLGLLPEAVDLFAGETDAMLGGQLPGTQPIASLVYDPDRLATYDIVFVNCGALAWEDGGPGELSTDHDVSANLRNFVEGGGRLYVTDLSYDLIERAFPSLVDYYGAGAGLDDAPEPAGAADYGHDLPRLEATIEDDGLADWLASTGDGEGGSITVRGLLEGWAMIDGVDDGLARVWVSGEEPERGRPLTVTFEAGCGRALFTSYHTVEDQPRTNDWTAQEKILAYLVLEIGVCITEPQIF